MIPVAQNLEELQDLLALWKNPVVAEQMMLDIISYLESLIPNCKGIALKAKLAVKVARMSNTVQDCIDLEIAVCEDATAEYEAVDG